MMPRLRWIVPTALIVLLAAGCRQQAQQAVVADLTIDLRVEPEAATVSDSTLIITVTDASGNPVSDATVSVRGDMSHAGMQPVLAESEGGADGEYTIGFEWTMAGDWIVEVTVELVDGTSATETFDLLVTAGEDSAAMDMAENTDMPKMDGGG